MTAEFITVERRYQVIVRVHLSGAGPRAVPYTERQRTYQPTILELTYRWNAENTDQTVDVTIHGRRELKDGKHGGTETECLWSREQWPDWVAALVEAHRPPVDASTGGGAR